MYLSSNKCKQLSHPSLGFWKVSGKLLNFCIKLYFRTNILLLSCFSLWLALLDSCQKPAVQFTMPRRRAFFLWSSNTFIVRDLPGSVRQGVQFL